MNHADIKNALPSYHDGELTPDGAEQMEHHLGICADCRADLAELQHLTAEFTARQGEAEINTDLFVQRVMARLPQPTPSMWQHLSSWWKIPALAMCALFLFSIGPEWADAPPTTSAVLCNDGSVAVSHLCSDDTAHTDELLNLMWGEL